MPPPAAPQQGKGMAVASMVLGIVSIALCLYWFIAFPAGVVAIVLAVIARRNNVGGGFALAGLITGIVGTAVGVIFAILTFTGSGLDAYCRENPDNPLCSAQQ
jgi:disulfide bond formation protein DsbB